MRFSDVVFAGARSLRGDAKRTGFSLLGMSIGVAAVLVLSGLGEGARQFLRGQFAVIGTDVVTVLPGKVETSGGMPGFGGVPNDLTLADAHALARGLPRVESVVPTVMGTETVGAGDRSRQAIVVGSTAGALQVRNLKMREGRFLPEGPWERGSRVVVLGPTVARELFPAESAVSKIVRIGGWRMRVIGVLASQGVHFGLNMDEIAFVPVATAQAMFDRASLFQIALKVRPGTNLERLEVRTTDILHERHGEEDFTVTMPDAILDSLQSILRMLTLGLAGVASISLAVAGIGIMNVMLVTVSERTGEIGLSKAVGALPRQILILFLAEAATLSALGSVLGLALGYGALWVAGWMYPEFPFHAPVWAAAAAVALSLVVGTTFGFWPALRAVRLDPVVALSGRAR